MPLLAVETQRRVHLTQGVGVHVPCEPTYLRSLAAECEKIGFRTGNHARMIAQCESRLPRDPLPSGNGPLA